MRKYTFYEGFTLAEVLITLGIIGIVAALTIPALVANYEKKQTVTQLRKVYADLNNAVRLSEVDNGPMQTWEYSQIKITSYEDAVPFIQKYYLPYFKSAKLLKKTELEDYVIIPSMTEPDKNTGWVTNFMVLNNGVIFSFFFNVPSGYIWCLADINGTQKPNKVGRDIFVFDVYNWTGAVNGNGFRVKFWANYFNDNEYYLRNYGQYACNEENTDIYARFYCGRLIELSGWTIPENYPW